MSFLIKVSKFKKKLCNLTNLKIVSNRLTFIGRSKQSVLLSWGQRPLPQSWQLNLSSMNSKSWHFWQIQQQVSPWKTSHNQFCFFYDQTVKTRKKTKCTIWKIVDYPFSWIFTYCGFQLLKLKQFEFNTCYSLLSTDILNLSSP
jgi:hypothetical protein